ncbi:GIP [Symbiodinium microadriaticum]|nr:GIP [Symbiodinium microadriaticum]
MPERHVQLFRNLQFKWQCYDAYCRVCLGLGLNHILQAMTYYCICHALVENQTPSLGLALVVLFQAATIFVAFLDLAGLQHREIITVQIVSIVPSIVTALEVSFSQRDKLGNLLPQQDYKLSPLSFLCHAMWLELWLRIAWPSGAEEKLAQLPRRFRQACPTPRTA